MTRPPSRVPVLLVLVWLGGLLAATSVGLLAVRLVAAQVGDPAVTPLSAVAAASATTVPTHDAPSPTTSARPAGASPSATPSRSAAAPAAVRSTTQTVATQGGTLGVQCSGTALRLLFVTPAQGWALDQRSVSGAEAEVRFTAGEQRLRARLSCASGAPRLVEQRRDEGGGRGRGGRGGGGDDD